MKIILLLAVLFIASPVLAEERSAAAAPKITIQRWIGAPGYRLDALAGQPYLLEFWATWCPPCIENLPHLEMLYNKYGKQGLRIIGISVDKGFEEVAEFAQKHEIIYPIALDGGTEYRYGVRGIPAAVLVDAAGFVVWAGHPAHKQLEDKIKQVIKDSPKPIIEGLDLSEFEQMPEFIGDGKTFDKAHTLLKEYAKGDDESAENARQLLEKIDERLQQRLKYANNLWQQGKTIAAIEVYSALIKLYGNTDAAIQAVEELKEIEKSLRSEG